MRRIRVALASKRSAFALTATSALVLAQMTVATEPASAYHSIGCRARSANITYWNNAVGFRDFEAIFDQAARDWNATPTPINYQRVYYAADAQIHMSHRYAGTSQPYATMYQRCDTTTGYFTNTTRDMVINNSLLGTAPSSEVRSTTNHELGHAIGLDHQASNRDCPYYPLMWPDHFRYTVCNVITPRADDIAGANAYY